MQESRAVQQRELIVRQLEGGAKLHCPMGDFFRKASAGVVAILHGARERDDDTLELIELAVELGDAKLDSHQCQQPGAVDRLDRNVIRARLESALALNVVIPGHQQHHRDLVGGWRLLDCPADLKALHVREHRLAEDEVALVRGKRAQRRRPVAGHDHSIAAALEQCAELSLAGLLVVGH